MTPTLSTRALRAIRLLLAAAALLTAAALPAHAANPSMLKDFNFDKPTFIHDLPFAQYKLVLQVSEDNPERWALTLNNAQNALDFLGQEKVRIVIVAYGPGLRMLLASSPMAKRISSLNDEGVEFDACHNTMEGMAKKLGHMPKLVPQAVIVPAGLVRIMQLEKAGFQYIKP